MILLDFIDFPEYWGSKMLLGVSRWGHAVQHAIDNNYAHLWPFIRAMVNIYATER